MKSKQWGRFLVLGTKCSVISMRTNMDAGASHCARCACVFCSLSLKNYQTLSGDQGLWNPVIHSILCNSNALILFPGPLFSSGGHPGPPGHHPSQTKSQSLDPFADLSDLSSSLQGNEGPTLCAKRLIFTFYYCVHGPWELVSASILNAHWLKD